MKNRILGIIISILLCSQVSAQIEGIYNVTDICKVFNRYNGELSQNAIMDTSYYQIEIQKTTQNNQYDYMITNGSYFGYYYVEVYIKSTSKNEFIIPEQDNSSYFELYGLKWWAGYDDFRIIEGRDGYVSNDSIYYVYSLSGAGGGDGCQCNGVRVPCLSIPKPQIIEQPKGEVVNIYDSMGRQICGKSIESLPAGMYILQYENGVTEKIVKQ